MQQKHVQRRQFDLQLHPEPKLPFPPPPRTKRLGHDQNFNTGTLPEAKGRLSQEDLVLKPLTISFHKWPTSKALQSKLALPVLLYTSLFSPHLLKLTWIRRDLSLVFCLLAGDFTIKPYLFSKANVIILASVCNGWPVLVQ